MAEFSRTAPPERISLAIDVPEYLTDAMHTGRSVFPVTEAMQVMVTAALERFPELGGTRLRDIRFDHALLLPSRGQTLAAAIELTRLDNGDMTAVLLTRADSGRARAKGLVRHVSFRIPAPENTGECSPLAPFVLPETAPDLSIEPDRLYQDLVPRDPAFRNVVEPLHLWPAGALATVSGGPWHRETLPGLLGSPFPLDAAIHAACAWGQRYAGIIAAPVAMERRYIFLPTRCGEIYTALILPAGGKSDPGVFDILIYDPCRRPCEFVSRLVMRRPARSRRKPPEWVTV